jgi:protein-arginine kinase activator protein McsA
MTVVPLILAYVSAMLAALTGVALYTEFRQRRFKPSASQDRIFRCQKCGCVYTDDADVDRSRCTQCGKMNEPIEF